jgi:hypothetical protein
MSRAQVKYEALMEESGPAETMLTTNGSVSAIIPTTNLVTW